MYFSKYLEKFKDDNIIIVIDDPRNLVEIDKLNEGIILLKDTVLVD